MTLYIKTSQHSNNVRIFHWNVGHIKAGLCHLITILYLRLTLGMASNINSYCMQMVFTGLCILSGIWNGQDTVLSCPFLIYSTRLWI